MTLKHAASIRLTYIHWTCTVKWFLMKLFKTAIFCIIKDCLRYFEFKLPSVLIIKRTWKCMSMYDACMVAGNFCKLFICRPRVTFVVFFTVLPMLCLVNKRYIYLEHVFFNIFLFRCCYSASDHRKCQHTWHFVGRAVHSQRYHN